MTHTTIFHRLVILLLLAALLAGCLTGCSGRDREFTELEDFKKARLGNFPGSPTEQLNLREFPEAELVHFTAFSDMLLALTQGKIDGFVLDRIFYQGVAWEQDGFTYLPQPLDTLEYAYLFPKNEAGALLKEEMDGFLGELKAEGELQRLQEKWFGETEPQEPVDTSGLTGENGVIDVVVGVDTKPLIYLKDGKYTGYEIEILFAFARARGYDLKLTGSNFDGTIMGVQTGKFDMGAYGFNSTPEREQSFLFSEPTIISDVVMITREPEKKDSAQRVTVEDLETATLGHITGSIYQDILAEQLPNARRLNFATPSDALIALSQGKIDAYVEDDVMYAGMRWDKKDITTLDKCLIETELAFAFNKGLDEKIKDQLNGFLETCWEDGTMDRLTEKWFGEEEPTEHPQYPELSAENGVLKVASDCSMRPMVYQKNGIATGYEIDLLTLFAEQYGYGLQIENVPFQSILAGLMKGKYDLAATCMTVTEERKEAVDFSVPHRYASNVVIVQKEEEVSSSAAAFFADVRDGFEKTFIRESRWKLILEGLAVTVLISLCAVVLGSLAGFGLYLLSRSARRTIRSLAGGIGKVYTRIVAGTPVVVILMILFYVVFASYQDLSGAVIAVIGFSLTFGAFVYSHMTVSAKAVDPGQTEAAYALGYSRNKTFFRIVLPQAMDIFFPSYCGEVVGLIKATAVVGYIAVNDLTRMGDIIRSNTYEAFFPLLSTAAIYFLLTWAAASLLRAIMARFAPKNRSRQRILKGIRTEK